MKYRIDHSAVTGVNGVGYFKNQIVDESVLIPGAIDYLKSVGAISAINEVSTDLKKDKVNKPPKPPKPPKK